MAKKRANGEGNIRKRADGRWEGRYTAGYHPETGKRIIKNVLGKTQAECKAKLSAAMYDYMKALQKRFDRQPHPELDTQIKSAQEELRRDMDATGRRKLLRLLDAQNTLLVESKLMSFTAGFKLAWGIAKELEADGLYSFGKEEEEHICHPAEQED